MRCWCRYQYNDVVADATYAATLLQHAKTLWDFAINHPGIYSHSVSAASGFYRLVLWLLILCVWDCSLVLILCVWDCSLAVDSLCVGLFFGC